MNPLLSFLDARAAESRRHAALAQVWTNCQPYILNSVPQLYETIATMIRQDKPVGEIRIYLDSFPGMSPGSTLTKRDITCFLEKGEPLFRSLLDIPTVLAEEERARQEALAKEARERNAERLKLKLQAKAAEAERKRKEFADALGIRPEAMERLQNS